MGLYDNDQDYRDAFFDKYERNCEIMAGDPDFSEGEARRDAYKHASRFTGGTDANAQQLETGDEDE